MIAIMSMRGILPIVLLFVFVLGAVSFILMTGAPPEEGIRDGAVKYVREEFSRVNLEEGKDFTLGAVEILSQTEEAAVIDLPVDSIREDVPSGFLLELKKTGGAWEVTHDLRDLFSQAATAKEFVQGVGGRLSGLYRDRYRIAVTIKEGTPFNIGLSRFGKDVIGTFEFRFAIPRSDGKHDRGIYSERFLYKGGEWVRQGRGQLLEGLSPR